MKRHTPANPSALIRALGPDPLVVSIGSETWPADLSSGFSMRRARPGRDPIGEPASCSVTVAVETLPSWRKGDGFSVELADTALDRLFGSQSLSYTNYVPNPGLDYGASTGGWVNLQAATLALVDDVDGNRPGSAKCLQVTCGADLDGVRTSPTAEVAGSENIGAGQPLFASVWVRVATGEQLRVALEHGYSAVGDPALVDTIDELTIVGDGQWRELTLGGPTLRTANYTPLLRFQSKSGAQVFKVDAALITVAEDQVGWFNGSSPGGVNDPAWQFYGFTVTYAWTGTVSNSWSTKFVDKLPAIEQARRRFVGKLSDLRLRSRRAGLSFVELIGVGNLAQLGGVTIGDEPWPQEALDARADRILAAAQAKGGPAYDRTASVPGVDVLAKDVDRRGAGDLLADLAKTAGPTFGLTELRDGTLLWTSGYADEVPGVAVPASLVPAELEHEQAELINDVTVTYGPEKPGAGYAVHTNLVPNPSFETNVALTYPGYGVLRLYQETAIASWGTKSCRVETTGAGANPYVYTEAATAIEGRRYGARARIRPGEVGADSRLFLRFYDSGGAILSSPTGPTVRSTAAGAWYTLSVEAVAPVGTATVRLCVQSYLSSGVAPANTMDVGDKWYIDSLFMRELIGDETYSASDYFDGASAAGGGWSYGWQGTAHASQSWRLTTADSPQLSVRAIDAASVATYGRHASTVETQLALYTDPNGTVYDRGRDEWLPGGWQLPQLSFDLLQLLDGRADNAFAPTSQGATTPTELAAQLARIELGSYLTIDDPGYYSGDPFDVSHLPASSVDAPGRVTALNESITASRWSLTTEQERTL